MQASSSGISLSSTPPPSESDIWGNGLPVDTSNPESLYSSSLRRRNGPSPSPNIPSSSSTPSLAYNGSQDDSNEFALRPRPGQQPPSQHPLAQVGPTPPTDHVDVLGDVSRPALKRLTTETERAVAESSRSGSEPSGSIRGSLDILRMSAADENQSGEVEVFVHTIKTNESLAGIALLYGIDLATLRKVNKLWTADSIHLRTHLFVPLEACKWNKASEILMRGPGEGQVTLYPKGKKNSSANGHEDRKGKGKEIARDTGSGHGTAYQVLNGEAGLRADSMADAAMVNGSIDISDNHGDDPWSAAVSDSTVVPDLNINSNGNIAQSSSSETISASGGRSRSTSTSTAMQFLPSTNMEYNSHPRLPIHSLPPSLLSTSDTHPTFDEGDADSTPRILDIVRIPSSQLRFFPRQKPPDQSHLHANAPALSSLDRIKFEADESHSQSGSRPGLGAGTGSGGFERWSMDETLVRASMVIRRNSDDVLGDANGPSIVNDLSTLPPHLRGHAPSHHTGIGAGGGTGADRGSPPKPSLKPHAKTTVVRLRPPQTTSLLPTASGASPASGLANRLSSLFTVPPPPPSMQPFAPLGNGGRLPSSRSTSASASRSTQEQRRDRMSSSTSTPDGLGRASFDSPSQPHSRTVSGRSTPIHAQGTSNDYLSAAHKTREESMELVSRTGTAGRDNGRRGSGNHFVNAPGEGVFDAALAGLGGSLRDLNVNLRGGLGISFPTSASAATAASSPLHSGSGERTASGYGAKSGGSGGAGPLRKDSNTKRKDD